MRGWLPNRLLDRLGDPLAAKRRADLNDVGPIRTRLEGERRLPAGAPAVAGPGT